MTLLFWELASQKRSGAQWPPASTLCLPDPCLIPPAMVFTLITLIPRTYPGSQRLEIGRGARVATFGINASDSSAAGCQWLTVGIRCPRTDESPLWDGGVVSQPPQCPPLHCHLLAVCPMTSYSDLPPPASVYPPGKSRWYIKPSKSAQGDSGAPGNRWQGQSLGTFFPKFPQLFSRLGPESFEGCPMRSCSQWQLKLLQRDI